MKIIFMGTPQIAQYNLKKLHNSNHEITAVVTSVDKPAGRGQKDSKSAVKEYAEQNNLLCLQPPNLKSPEFIEKLKNLNADIYIVVAFRMLPKEVWSLPKLGTINLHASLLPNYRGAAPINWAIINGETKTGITTFLIDEKIDTGKIILQKEIEIQNTETAETLHDKIMIQGADLLIETIEIINNKKIDAIEQEKFITNQMQLKHAPKIFKENCEIDWSKTTIEIYNFVRGLSPIPCAWSTLINDSKNIVIKILEGKYEQLKHNSEFGSVLIDKKYIKIACSDGYYIPLIIKAEGKKQMSTEEFLRGFKLIEPKFLIKKLSL